ncbi:MAG: PAS domain S-box protein [Candidatus Eisenbacteria bacterium]
MKALLAAAAVGFVVSGAWFYRAQEQRQRDAVESELTAVGTLKAANVAAWRDERLNDAGLLMENPFLRDGISRWLEAPGESAAEADLLGCFESLRVHGDYENVLLVSPDGEVLLSLEHKAHGLLADEVHDALTVAFGEIRPTLTELHTGHEHPVLHLGVVGVFTTEGNGAPEPLAGVILVCEAHSTLCSILENWPTQSRTAETILVRKDGDGVRFLSGLRHEQGSPLNRRIPLSEAGPPTVAAVSGEYGVLQGRDYRGVEVLAVVGPVTGSSWSVISKVDAAEALASWRSRSVVTLLLTGGFALLVVAVMLFLWQRHERVQYQALYESEAALRESDRILGDTGRLAKIGGWEHNLATGGVVWTSALHEIVGIEPGAQSPGVDEHMERYVAEHRRTLEEAYRRSSNEGAPFDLELQFRTGDDRLIWCRVSGEPVMEGGQCVRMRGTFQDITDRKVSELERIAALDDAKARGSELLEQKEKYRLLADNTTDIIWLMDLSMQFTYVNPAAETLLGWKPQEMVGTSLRDYCAHEQLRAIMDIVQDTVAALPEIKVQRFETELLRRDGEAVSVEVAGRLLLDDEGRPFAIQGVTHDITERRRAAEAQRISEERWRSYVERAPYGVFVANERGQYVSVNPAASQITGYDESELVTMGIPDMLPPEDAKAGLAPFRELLRTGESFIEVPFTHKSGERRWWTVASVKLSETRFLGFVEDTTEKRKAQQERDELKSQLMQAQKMEAVGRLAGGVAHDFNNMLQVILGNAELALPELAPDAVGHAELLEIQAAARNSANLTRQLLAFARQQTIAPEVLDLNETISSMLKMLRRLIGEDIELTWMPGAQLWPVELDPSQVNQLLANLCVNARDALKGGGSLKISTMNATVEASRLVSHPDAKTGEFVLLSVTDDGTGMDKTTLASIFDPFFTTKEVGQGTGLGLATVYGIVKQNDGFIDVRSAPGEGAAFSIYLPRSTDAVCETANEPAGEQQKGRGETVLLVEDEPAILDLCSGALKELGYSVLVAGTPAQALELAGEHQSPVHLLLTDIVMPEMNGRELAERLGTRFPDMKKLYMSGYTADILAERGVLWENINLLQKPFDMGQMASTVRRVLDGP